MSAEIDPQAFKHWTPAAQERALEALKAQGQRTWRPFWCPNPVCNGDPHDDWTWHHARADQRPPADPDWLVWLLLSGRGSGKTRTGAEYLHRVTKVSPRVAVIGATSTDVRQIMVEGESGLVTIANPKHRPLYEPSKRKLTWPNGAVGLLFSAEEPDRLRGPEHYAVWWDEPAHAPLVQDCWDNLMFGLRLGQHPRVVATTTPKPRPWLKALIADGDTRVARASTYDNLANLAPVFAQRIIARYEGTRLGRQELHGELLEDVEGALWVWAMIEADRVLAAPDLVRTVVAIDPAGSSRAAANETAIVVAGRDAYGHLFVIADRSGHYTPLGWATAAMRAAEDHDADAIVAERNFGGEMVESQLRLSGYTGRLVTVHAKKGKDVRAEPVVGLYEQHLVHHVGVLGDLEEQMCFAAGTLVETGRGHVPIESVTDVDEVMTAWGLAPLAWAGRTGWSTHLTTVTHEHGVVVCTPWHDVWTENRGYVPACDVEPSDLLVVRPSPAATDLPWPGEDAGSTPRAAATIAMRRASSFIAPSGSHITTTSPPTTSSTTATSGRGTTASPTSSSSPTPNTTDGIDSPTTPESPGGRPTNTPSTHDPSGPNVSRVISCATAAVGASSRPAPVPGGAAGDVADEPGATEVYDLTVASGYLPQFFADGVLVHNCSWVPYSGADSPDRLDAVVYALTMLAMRPGTASVASPVRSAPRPQAIPLNAASPNLGIRLG